MTKPNVNFTVNQMKDYIRSNKLNHPAVKLGMKRADMIAGLKTAGYWEETEKAKKTKAKPKTATPKPEPETKTTIKKAPKKISKKKQKEIDWEKLKVMPKFINFVKKAQADDWNAKRQEGNDYVASDILGEMGLSHLRNPNKNNPTLYKNSIGKLSKKYQDEYNDKYTRYHKAGIINIYREVFKSRFKGSIPDIMKWIDRYDYTKLINY